ncbi:helix-turn-helix transcriptional regulator [Azotosporobacter soli]|uniref:helix-turn-helix domain-containing protein n=1 Tax=Azotosporobacter soli TaxID=3055040 RepID=UPI0031FE467E
MFQKEILAQRLKEERLAHKLTQDQVGQLLGVVKQTVGHWETGLRLPTIDSLVAMADYYNVSLDYLTGRKNDPARTKIKAASSFKYPPLAKEPRSVAENSNASEEKKKDQLY